MKTELIRSLNEEDAAVSVELFADALDAGVLAFSACSECCLPSDTCTCPDESDDTP